MAEAGHDLVLVARSSDQLSKVQKELTNSFHVNISVYSADLSLPGSASKLYERTKKEKIEIIANNAGVGLKGDFFHDDLDRTIQMAQLNMLSLMELCKLFGNDFIENNKGKILNIGSITAFFPGPKQPVYYATKAFVRSLSRALAYNLRNTNVTVTTLHPGVTKTKFFKSSNAADFKGGASARSVAMLGYKAMMSGKIEVTHGLSNKLLTNLFTRILPYRLQTILVDKASEV
jgi:short-subunit dehydrogenase